MEPEPPGAEEGDTEGEHDGGDAVVVRRLLGGDQREVPDVLPVLPGKGRGTISFDRPGTADGEQMIRLCGPSEGIRLGADWEQPGSRLGADWEQPGSRLGGD